MSQLTKASSSNGLQAAMKARRKMSSPGPLVDEMCENSGHLQRQQKKQYTGTKARFLIKVKETGML